jgi:branched-chain amino acid transport system permease protein
VSGILFANLVALQASALTFLVIASFAAGIIGRFRSLTWTLVGGLVIGVVQACATPFASVTRYRDAAPFVLAFVALLVLDRLNAARDVRAV